MTRADAASRPTDLAVRTATSVACGNLTDELFAKYSVVGKPLALGGGELEKPYHVQESRVVNAVGLAANPNPAGAFLRGRSRGER